MPANPLDVKITSKVEMITPAKAAAYLSNMAPNRRPKEATVAMYANDMVNGEWLLSHQGIAFDVNGLLFDGQHRLLAIIRANVPAPILVLRGFPAKQTNINTMDTVDCGVGRSLGDRLRIMGCYAGNPNLACAVARQIAAAVMGPNCRASRKLSIANVLAIIAIWKDELGTVCQKVDRCGFGPMRNAYVVAAFTLACAAYPNKTRAAVDKLTTGAGLTEKSPLLELRTAFINDRAGDRSEKMFLCFSALLCEWHELAPKEMYKTANLELAADHFKSRQADRFDQVKKLFLIMEDPAVKQKAAKR